MVPEVHAVYRRALLNDRFEAASSFIGGGSSFTGQGPEPAENKYTLGVQVKYYAVDGLEMTAAYDLELRQDYLSHAGVLRAGWRF